MRLVGGTSLREGSDGAEIVQSMGYYMLIIVSGPAVMVLVVGGTSPH